MYRSWSFKDKIQHCAGFRECYRSSLLRNSSTNNFKDRPRLTRAYGCICKLNLVSVPHNGDCVLSDLINEDLVYRTGTIGVDGVRPGERGTYGPTAGIPRPKSRNAGWVGRRVKHDSTRKSTRFESAEVKERFGLGWGSGKKQVKPEPVAARDGCRIACHRGSLRNSFSNDLKRACACICKLNVGSALHNGDFILSDFSIREDTS